MAHPKNFVDRTGSKYGKLTVVEYVGDRKWLCECDCGNTKIVSGDDLHSGHTQSCGCLRHNISKHSVDMTGKRFGKLVVIDRSGTVKGKATWNCKCDCGNMCIRTGDVLRRGISNSCGCMESTNRSNAYKKHGLSGSRIFNIWVSMKSRTNRPSDNNYVHYGARGIIICDEWKNDFMTFYKWSMENGYADNLSIDRIDNNGNYEPSNCRWVDRYVQQNNTSQNHYITRDGVTHTLIEWCRILNISYSTVLKRMRKGLSEELWFYKGRLPKKEDL